MAAERPNVEYFDLRGAADELRDASDDERSILTTVNRKVAEARTVEEIIDFLFDTTSRICPCDRMSLAFVTDGGERLVSHYQRAAYEPVHLRKGYAEGLRGSSLKEVIDSGRPRIIRDLQRYLAEHPHSNSTKLLVREGVRSSMTCPLAVAGRRVGVLFRSSRRPDSYGEHEVRMHLAVAERLSQAVEKAWMIEQLRAANESYAGVMGFVSHELKSPVASMISDAEMMAGGYVGSLTDEQKARMTAISKKGRYLLGLVDEYMELARIESGLRLEARRGVDFAAAVVEPVVEMLNAQIDESGMRLVREDRQGLSAECDPALMRVVMMNLLGNAAKYGSRGGEIRLRAAIEDGALVVSVRNDGPGFPADQKDLLFRRFSRIRTPELMKRKGSGLGLYSSWRIIQLHGGRIWAESEEGHWAEFTFRIPQPLGSKNA